MYALIGLAFSACFNFVFSMFLRFVHVEYELVLCSFLLPVGFYEWLCYILCTDLLVDGHMVCFPIFIYYN